LQQLSKHHGWKILAFQNTDCRIRPTQKYKIFLQRTHLLEKQQTKKVTTMSNTATSTNPFDALSNDIIPNHEALTDPEAQAYTMNPFDDDAAVIDDFVNEDENTDKENSQEKLEEKTPQTYINPFDDPANLLPEDPNKAKSMPDKTEERVRYASEEDDEDSVQSMLEMMEAKNKPEQQQQLNDGWNTNSSKNSIRKKAKEVAKWSWKSPASLLGGLKDDDDEDSVESYDCIALSSLKDKLRTGTGNAFDEESGETDDSDTKSDGTGTTKNESESGLSPPTHSRIRNLDMKYVIPLASFLAVLLLLGIIALSYSLYSVRNEEHVSVFTRDFWKNDEIDSHPLGEELDVGQPQH